jgi:surfeit locus 1 family protein
MAALFIKLGFWQIDRRRQRLARNAVIAARMREPVISLRQVTGDTASNHYRRVRVEGHPDFDRDIALTLRGNLGAPGVDVLTPMVTPGTDTATIVNRGWIYTPDGMTADLSRWRESDSSFTGYIEEFDPTPDSVRLNGIRRANHAGIARQLPYPVRPFYIVATSDSAPAKDHVLRLAAPVLDEGPHLSYAIQWFSFATIALVGGGYIVVQSMRKTQVENQESTP